MADGARRDERRVRPFSPETTMPLMLLTVVPCTLSLGMDEESAKNGVATPMAIPLLPKNDVEKKCRDKSTFSQNPTSILHMFPLPHS